MRFVDAVRHHFWGALFNLLWPSRVPGLRPASQDTFPVRDAAHRSHDRALKGSLHELEMLRRAGAI